MASDRKMAAVPASAATLESRLTALGKRFSAFPEVEAVYLFGSAARGARRKHSDIDIALLTRERKTRRSRRASGDLVQYVQAACDALGTDRVDVVLLRRAPVVLRHEVFREGKLLLASDPEALSRFRQESSREYLDTIPLRRMFEESYFRRIRRNGFGRQIFHR